MNNTSVYKYRTLHGLVEYKILNGQFGIDDTLHLQDTSCKHSGPNCEIEVVKSESGDCYQFSKSLNQSAKDYEYFHTLEKYWATKKDAYIEHLHNSIDSCRQNIDRDEKDIANANEKLVSLERKEVNYLPSFMAKAGMKCYIEHTDTCRIIGTISFEDGSTGFLTDSNYYNDDDGYDGDRIILINGKNDRIITENGLAVFLSKTDYDNLKTNNFIKQLTNDITICKKNAKRRMERINAINHIITIKDTLTLEQIMEMESNAYLK